MHRKYRIPLVSDYYYPNKGGIESHIHNLALSLISLGHHVIIITHKYSGHLGIIDNGIKVHYLNIPIVAANTTFPNMYSNISLISTFLNEKIEVVHGHQSMSNLTLEAIFHAKTIGLKTVLTEHSLFDLGGFENIIIDRLCMLILRSCDLFITVSMTAKVNFVERLFVEWNKVYVIQNAIDSNIFYAEKNDENMQENIRNRDVYSQKASKENVRDDKREKGAIDESKKSNSNETKTRCNNYIKLDDGMKNHRKIIIVSRLVKRKGIDILLDIIPMLFKRLESISVIIVGDGPYRDNLEQMIDYNNLRDVHFYGELDHESLANLLRQCDVFLNTSLTEAFCMAILEAAACGCKVVSTNVGGIHEVLPETVLTLTDIDPVEIVDAICNVLCNEKCDISEIIENVYRWELVALKTVDVYDSIKSGSIDFKTRIEHYHWFWEVICRMYIVFEYIFVSIYLKLYH